MAAIDDMIDSAMEAARAPYYRAIAAQLDVGGTPPDWGEFRRVIARAYLLARALGRAAAAEQTAAIGHEFEAPPTEQELIDKSRFDRFGLEGDGSALFINRDFAKAIRALAGKVPRLRSEIDALRIEAQKIAEAITAIEEREAVRRLAERYETIRALVDRSFWVSGLDREDIRATRGIVADWLRAEGAGHRGSKSTAEFIDEAGLRGVSGLTRSRLETVMRTNLISASNEGTADMLRPPRVRTEFPLVAIDEIRDRRTRGNPQGEYPDGGFHWQMDGYIGTLHDIERQGLRPPNGYNCRAGLRPIGREEAGAMGLLRSSGAVDPAAVRRYNGQRVAIIDAGLYPDPGFKIPAFRP
jgi:hypothetical protein